MKKEDIIELAQSLKAYLHTNNPYAIAEYYGFRVCTRKSTIKDFKAQIIKANGYPTIISINDCYSELSQKVLCAHELGHALLHEGSNTFAVTSNNINTNVEYEANLFAVALLFDQEDVNMSFSKMDNYTLKSMLDANIYM